MGNEMFQARLDDSFADQIHQYRKDRHLSKSEIVRKALRELVIEDDTTNAASGATPEPEETRLETAARLGEKAALLSVIFAVLAMLLPIIAALAIEHFSLTLGSFGALLIFGASATTGIVAAVALALSVVLLLEALIREGVHVGPFGDLLEKLLTPKVAQ